MDQPANPPALTRPAPDRKNTAPSLMQNAAPGQAPVALSREQIAKGASDLSQFIAQNVTAEIIKNPKLASPEGWEAFALKPFNDGKTVVAIPDANGRPVNHVVWLQQDQDNFTRPMLLNAELLRKMLPGNVAAAALVKNGLLTGAINTRTWLTSANNPVTLAKDAKIKEAWTATNPANPKTRIVIADDDVSGIQNAKNLHRMGSLNVLTPGEVVDDSKLFHEGDPVSTNLLTNPDALIALIPQTTAFQAAVVNGLTATPGLTVSLQSVYQSGTGIFNLPGSEPPAETPAPQAVAAPAPTIQSFEPNSAAAIQKSADAAQAEVLRQLNARRNQTRPQQDPNQPRIVQQADIEKQVATPAQVSVAVPASLNLPAALPQNAAQREQVLFETATRVYDFMRANPKADQAQLGSVITQFGKDGPQYANLLDAARLNPTTNMKQELTLVHESRTARPPVAGAAVTPAQLYNSPAGLAPVMADGKMVVVEMANKEKRTLWVERQPGGDPDYVLLDEKSLHLAMDKALGRLAGVDVHAEDLMARLAKDISQAGIDSGTPTRQPDFKATDPNLPNEVKAALARGQNNEFGAETIERLIREAPATSINFGKPGV